MNKGHKNLQIYHMAHQLAIQIHQMTLALPAYERFEEASQIRRSSKSVVANIVEGYALRKYKNEFVHYLFRAYGSCEETVEHLELLFDSASLKDETLYKQLLNTANNLCGKILRYIQAVDHIFATPHFMKEPKVNYTISKGLKLTPRPSRTLHPPKAGKNLKPRTGL